MSGPRREQTGNGQTRSAWRIKLSVRIGVLAGLLFGISSLAQSQEILLLHDVSAPANDEKQLRDLTASLGLRLQIIAITSSHQRLSIATLHRSPALLALLVPASLLATLDPALVREAGGPDAPAVPILVFGITPEVDPSLLARWSNGAFDRCIPFRAGQTPGTIAIARGSTLTGNLSGLQLPEVTAPACRLIGDAAPQGQALLTADGDRQPAAPLLYQASIGKREVFLVPQLKPVSTEWIGKPSSLAQAFSSVAPFLLFLRHVERGFAWHLEGHYANFTVDDPWLTEPYGNLNYEQLLHAMETHHFHTTIAFVPWNYDRSRPEVVRLFRDHPTFYSLCLHGNNHDHREFGAYAQNSLEHQVADLRQGVARMEKLHALTGLRYDRFMVFPHAVAPQSTFAALHENGFLGTANSSNVPLDQPFPADPLFLLKPYSIAYGDTLSLSRYSTEGPISQVDLAIQIFLGNPLLFYAHQAFFARGAGTFNSTADLVNRIDPKLQWLSLGELARHLYEVRRRPDGNMDVRMLANEMTLLPSPDRGARYFVSSTSLPSDTLTGVEVDGTRINYQQTATGILFQVDSPKGKSQSVHLRYLAAASSTEVGIAKTDLGVNLLRKVSDVRDLYLSRTPLGRAVTDAYYNRGGAAGEGSLERHWYLPLILVCLGVGVRSSIRRKRASLALPEPSPALPESISILPESISALPKSVVHTSS